MLELFISSRPAQKEPTGTFVQVFTVNAFSMLPPTSLKSWAVGGPASYEHRLSEWLLSPLRGVP
jgi:hypothetical protein